MVAGRAATALVCAFLAAAMMLLVERLHDLERERLDRDRRAEIVQAASAARARLESELNATLFITTGLVGYVTAYDDFLEPERVTTALAVIYEQGRHVRNVGLAPGNRITYIYPVEGNETALGTHYRDLPAQWPEVRRAMQQRRTVLTGPVDLVQGGQALIARTPVYIDSDRYWGILSIVIDMNSLFEAADFSASEGVEYALRWRRGRPGQPGTILGREEVFSADPVVLDIPVPGGAWQLAASPTGLERLPPALRVYRVAGHIVAIVIAALLFLVVEERRRIAWLATHDSMTQLANRRSFDRVLDHQVRRAEARGGTFGLLYVDLDGFKEINDAYGHARGDEVLARVAARLAGLLDDDEFVARIGGDEFAVLSPRLGGHGQARQRARTLRDALAGMRPAADLDAPLGASVGIAVYPQDGTDAEALLRHADADMYRAKDRPEPEPEDGVGRFA